MQNQVILSLGSNKGEKLLQIKEAIAQIHLQIGTVIEVSPIYQSDSWGFESDDFYNCIVLIHTEKSPLKILSSIMVNMKPEQLILTSLALIMK